jgi:hypothetical protein
MAMTWSAPTPVGGVGQRLHFLGLEIERAFPVVENDEGVPGAVHLPEFHAGEI